MTHDKKIIVGNWKMNLNVHESSLYLNKLSEMIKVHRDVEVILAPSMLSVQTLSLQVNLRQFKLAAQNFYWRDQGAYTGEVSASQLSGIVQYAIVGHSERRHIFGDSEKDIRSKVQAALRNKITPILCIGETAIDQVNEEVSDVIRDQLVSGLANVSSEEISEVILAYEPVASIGTGKNASPTDVHKIVKLIKHQIKHLYGEASVADLRILYGGSVNDSNAAGYLAVEGIDGLLVGNTSLNPHEFCSIVDKAHKIDLAVEKE